MTTENAYLDTIRSLQAERWPISVPRELRYPIGEVPLTDYLRYWARTTPEKSAIIFHGASLSYGELDRQSDAFARLLIGNGMGPGERVAVFLPNCPQFAIAFYGILKAGCIHVPVNPLFKARELAHELKDVDARWLVTTDALVSLVEEVRADVALERILVTSVAEGAVTGAGIDLPEALINTGAPARGYARFYEELARAPDVSIDVALSLDAPAALNYTGGTTGLPKGCIHTQGDMIYVGASVSTTLGLKQDDVGLCFLPVFWIAGESHGLIVPVFAGATMVLMARWDPVAVMKSIDRYTVSYASFLVDNAVEILDHPARGDYDLTSLRLTQVSSFVKKLNLDFRARWRELTGTTMIEAAWGMTETHTYDTFTSGMQKDDYDLKAQPVFVGLPMPGTEFKICDFETGALLPLGSEGELCVRTPSLLKGYWGNPEATAQLIRDGWFHTGDLANICEEGYLHFLGRRREMLKVNGVSVFPAEIEALLGQHSEVIGSAVIGRPDAQKGQVPVAFIRLAEGASLTREELEIWCRENLSVFKVPEIRLVDALPMTATGKVKKEELAQLL